MRKKRLKHRTGFLLPALAVAVLGTSGCGKTETAQQLVAEARQYQQKGDTRAAIIQLKSALQKKPEDAEVRYLLGTVHIDAGDPKSAEKELRKAIELKMSRTRVLPALGRALLMQGEFGKVLDETGNAGDGAPEILALRGHALMELGQVREAKTLFAQALARQPGFADALLGQARVALSENNVGGAADLIDKALVSAPKNLDALLMKGEAQRLASNREGAIAAYRKVIEYYPDNVPARLDLASIDIGAGKYGDAQAHIDAVRKIAPASPIANYLNALMEFRKNNHSRALESVQEVLKTLPGHVPSLVLAGAAEYALGQYRQAGQHLGDALERAPNSAYARKLLVATLLRDGQIQRAGEFVHQGLKLAPEDAALWALAGEVSMQARDFARASRYLAKAAELDPKNAGVRASLGVSRLAAGESDRTMADLEAAVGLDSSLYQADLLLIMSHIGRNDFDRALGAVQNLEKKQANNPLTYNLKGAIHIGKKDFAGARKAFEQALALQPAYLPAAMNLAQLDLRDKNPQAARKRLESVLEKDGNNPQAMLAFANLLGQAGGSEQEVLGWLERAKKADPKSAQPLLAMSRHYLRSGDAGKAMVDAQAAMVIAPDSPEVLDALGAAQLAAGEKNPAVTTFSKLVSIQPQSPAALYRLAAAQSENGNQAGAVQTLRKALELKPDNPEALGLMGALELRAGRNAEAMAIARRAQKLAAISPAGHILEGDVLMADKKYAAAARAYEQAYGVSRNGQIAVKLHAAYSLAGKPEEGEARVRQWLNESSGDFSARLYLAGIKTQEGKYKEAAELYRVVLKTQPRNAPVLNNLAWAYRMDKDPRALETAEMAYGLKPDSAEIADTLGWVLMDLGRIPRSLELLQKAVSLAPDAPQIRYHLAQALFQSGDRAGARQELGRVLSGGKFPQREEAAALLKQLGG